MRRRHYFAVIGSLPVLGLSGCLASDGGESSDDSGESDEDDSGEANGSNDASDSGDGSESNDGSEDDSGDDDAAETEDRVDEDALDAFRDDLESEGIDVDYLNEDDGELFVDFISEADDAADLDDEATIVAHAYAEHVTEFDELDRAEGWGLTDEFDVIGVFRVKTDWADAYDSGNLSEAEYLENVHETIE